MRTIPWRVAIAALALALLAACPSSPGTRSAARRHSQVPSSADFEGIHQESLEIEIGAPAVKSYGAPVDHPLSAVEASIALALADQPLTHRPALSRMVRQLATSTPDRLNVPPALVDGLMAWSGLVDPPPRLTVVEMSDDPHGCATQVIPMCDEVVASLVEQVEATLPDEGRVVFGVGVAALPDGRTRMMVAVLELAVQLEPIPSAGEEAAAWTVAGRLVGSRTKPVIEVVTPRGRWQRMPSSVSVDGRFSARVRCDDGLGAYQVEVLAEGRHGIEVVANFPIYCGLMPPTSIAVIDERIDESVTADQLARANFLYLNEEREKRGLPELVWDAEAAAVSYGHSRDMHDNDFVGHISPSTGDVSARFSRAGMQGFVIRENVARGYGPLGIHASLMGSPGHRANLLATDVTHVGVGVVVGEPETPAAGGPRPVFVTQNFYKKPGAGAPTRDLGPALQAKIDAARIASQLPPVRWQDPLSAIAERRAIALGRGRAPPKGYEQEVFALGFTSVEVHRVSSIDFDSLATVDLWSMPELEAGVGVVRTRESGGESGGERGGAETFLVVVLVGLR